MLALLITIAQRLVIPEVIDYIKRRQAETGQIPTVEEVQAEFIKTITEGITKGQNWLDSHPG